MPSARGIRPLLVAAAALAGCSLLPWRGGPPAPIRIAVAGAARLNPDEQGQSLPTAVRIYQLASPAGAQRAELPDLLRDPKEVLGEDLLAVAEILVVPGGRAEKVVPREKKARALLVAGIFRRPAGTTWRDIVEMPGERSRTDLEYALEDYRLERR